MIQANENDIGKVIQTSENDTDKIWDFILGY